MRLAQAAMEHRDTSVSEQCCELGIKPVTLYRLRQAAGRVARAGREGSRHLNRECSVLDAGGARAQPLESGPLKPSKWALARIEGHEIAQRGTYTTGLPAIGRSGTHWDTRWRRS